MKRMNRRGFTLIELMIVVAIIGVLAAIAVPNFREARRKSNMRACYANQKTILGALEMYNLDYGISMTINGKASLEILKSENYLSSVPDDPGCATGEQNYQSNDAGDVWCTFHGAIDTCMDSSCNEPGTGKCGS